MDRPGTLDTPALVNGYRVYFDGLHEARPREGKAMRPLRRLFAATFIIAARMVTASGTPRRSRVRLMLRHTSLVAVAACLLLVGVIAAAVYFGERPTSFKLAVGPADGEDARLIQAIADQLMRDRSTIRIRPIMKDGPAAAAKAIDSGEADLAVVRRDVAIPRNAQAVAVVRQDVVAAIVPAEGSPARGGVKPKGAKSGKAKRIEKLEDIAGHRIGLVSRDDAPAKVLDVILKQYEIPQDKVGVVPLDPRDVAASLRAHPVDAIFAIAPVTSQIIGAAIDASATDKEAPRVLAVGAAAAIENRWPVYESIEIKAGALGGRKPLPEEDLTTIGFSYYLVARKTLSEQKVGNFTKLLFGLRQSMVAEFPPIAKLAKPATDSDAAVLAHPGAAAYFDGEQKTFFDRYSDHMFWGLMLISGLGSAITWVASYVKADARLRRLRTLEQLLDVAKQARTVETTEGLEELRGKVDDILQRTILQPKRKDVDEAALGMFTLALDQAQRAISERQAALTAAPRVALVPRADVTLLSAAKS